MPHVRHLVTRPATSHRAAASWALAVLTSLLLGALGVAALSAAWLRPGAVALPLALVLGGLGSFALERAASVLAGRLARAPRVNRRRARGIGR